MHIYEMNTGDLDEVLPLYIEYYNHHEGRSWTEKSAGKRIHQVLSMEDSYSLIMRNGDGEAVGFAMGYFKQYDDIVGYTLEEIIISSQNQGRGLGSLLLREAEKRVKEKGASCVELQAVSDEIHERYYGRAGYQNAGNFVMKVKWLA